MQVINTVGVEDVPGILDEMQYTPSSLTQRNVNNDDNQPNYQYLHFEPILPVNE